MKTLLLLAAFASGLASAAEASFVQSAVLPPGPYASPHPSEASGTTTDLVGSSGLSYRSPFDGTAAAAEGAFTIVGRGGKAVFNMEGDHASLIWGSPDPYNVLSFFSGPDGTGSLIEELRGTMIGTSDGTGAVFVTVTPALPFGSIVLTNPGLLNGFEISALRAWSDQPAVPPPSPIQPRPLHQGASR